MSQPCSTQPTDTMRCIEKLITVFQRYAGKDNKMSMQEFENYMKTELAAFTQNQKDPNTLKRMMCNLDGSASGGQKDGYLDFQEFLNLTGGLTVSCDQSLVAGGKVMQQSQLTSKNSTDTEWCIEKLIVLFHSYAGKDKDSCKMSFAEFENFMKMELAAFTQNQKDPNLLKKMMSRLDGSASDGQKDGQLDFQEFLNLIGGFSCSCHQSILADQGKTKK
ncbi:protein S100-A11 [Rhinatrema bivittatum]|uniref:protein S100-A11 n=1 Tax=Rhinatrema bivittatum TaxID=194408 RepID=UPI001125FE2A|nr:protein S100-A11 [Rhinatrema bivittatum]